MLEVFLNDAIRNRLVRLGRMVTDSRLKALVINLRHWVILWRIEDLNYNDCSVYFTQVWLQLGKSDSLDECGIMTHGITQWRALVVTTKLS